ncbi:hypothetical protein [Streptomyces sp. NPDC014006]|uniref:hypothetical protein n=1 Tax=Streptomyces sp. NPDC014006 TaxID=3364870 RepID=UPI0036F8386A
MGAVIFRRWSSREASSITAPDVEVCIDGLGLPRVRLVAAAMQRRYAARPAPAAR